jgi:hypothetical protein
LIKNYLSQPKLGMIELLFERGTKKKELVPKNSKNKDKVFDEMINAKIIVCDNPDAEEDERTYSGNPRSRIFRSLFAIDIELGKNDFERKMKARASMFAIKKK